MRKKRLILILSTAIVLLLIPYIAMQLTPEVNWSIMDFIVMGILLSGAGLMLEFALSIVKNVRHRILVCGFILFTFLLVWAELAVGILGTAFAGS